MAKLLNDLPTFAELINRYRQIKRENLMDALLADAEAAVSTWQHAEKPWFPEIPFAQELYGRKWIDASDKTFSHGLDEKGRVAFIRWYTSVAYLYQPQMIESLFVLRGTRMSELQAVRHVTLGGDNQVSYVANIVDYRSFLSVYEYDDGRIARIVTVSYQHPNIDLVDNDWLPIESQYENVYEFCYGADGRIESGPDPGPWP
jgi:hypothetical protein